METKEDILTTLETKQGIVKIINLKDHPQYLADFKKQTKDYMDQNETPELQRKTNNDFLKKEIYIHGMSYYNSFLKNLDFAFQKDFFPLVILALDKESHVIGQVTFLKTSTTLIGKEEPEIMAPLADFAFVTPQFRSSNIGAKLDEVGFGLLYKEGYKNVFCIPLTKDLQETFIRHGACLYGECQYIHIKPSDENEEEFLVQLPVLNYNFEN